MNSLNLFLKRNSSTILTVLGSAGVVATAILSVKAVPKANKLLDEAYNKKGDALTTAEKIKAAWIAYVPAAITGVSTVACIFGINYLSVRNQASLMSAYALLDNTFKDYRGMVNKVYGEDADQNINNAVMRSKFDAGMELHPDKALLFYDHHSMRYFESTMENVKRAEKEFLEDFHTRGYSCLNEYYDLLGIPRMSYGYQLGWFDLESNDPYNCQELEFMYDEVTVKDDLKCWVISTNMPASYDYIL